VGIALAVAFHPRQLRAAKRKRPSGQLFWVDMTRSTLWVLCRRASFTRCCWCRQGVVQNFKPYDTAKGGGAQQVQRVGQDGKPVTGQDGKPVMDTVTDQVIASGTSGFARSHQNAGKPTAADS